ncbi:hypothetical protein D9M69_663990 [compost metagenome]
MWRSFGSAAITPSGSPLTSSAPGTAGSSICAVALRASTITGAWPSISSCFSSSTVMRSICTACWNRLRSTYLYRMNSSSKAPSTLSAVPPMVDRMSSTSSMLWWK